MTQKCIYPPLPDKHDLIYFLESYYYPYNQDEFKEFHFKKGDLIKIGYVNQTNNIIKLNLPNVQTKENNTDRYTQKYTYTYTKEELNKFLIESKGINWIESGIQSKCRIIPGIFKDLFMKDKTTYKIASHNKVKSHNNTQDSRLRPVSTSWPGSWGNNKRLKRKKKTKKRKKRKN